MSDFQDLDLGQSTGPEESLSGDFLKNIPDADRAVVERYVKDWDAGVTRRFQKIHEQYAPYKDLDPDDVYSALNMMQLLERDPEFIYTQLAEYLQQQGKQLPQFGQPEPQETYDEEEYDPYADKFNRMEALVTSLAEQFIARENQSQQQEEDAQLDSVLSDLHEQFGDFNEQFVLAQMLQGADPEDAVAAWGEVLDQELQQRRTRPPAPIMGSGGGVPGNGVDPSKLSRTQTQDYIAQMLAHSAQQAQ